MGADDIARIWQALDQLRETVARQTVLIETQADMIVELRGDIRAMAANGCAKAVLHAGQADQIADHEKRLRDEEAASNRQVGAASLLGGILGIIGSVLTKKLGWT